MLKPSPNVREITVAEVVTLMDRKGIREPIEEIVEGVQIPGLAETKRDGDAQRAKNIRREWFRANSDRMVLISWAASISTPDWRKAKFCLR